MLELPIIESDTDHHANSMRSSREKKKSSVFWSKASSGSSLYRFFLFAPVGGPLLFLILKNRPQLPTPRNALTKATILYIGGLFFHLQRKILPPPNPPPPSCPFLRTLQYQRDWRKKESKRIIYTSILIQGCSTRFVGGEGGFFMTPPALAELQVAAAAAAAVAAFVVVVVTPYFHSLRH